MPGSVQCFEKSFVVRAAVTPTPFAGHLRRLYRAGVCDPYALSPKAATGEKDSIP
jgi:hypothetical protein